MRRPLRIAAPILAAFALTAASPARAYEIKDLLGKPLAIDITNTAINNYRFDNRNDFFDGLRKPSPGVRVDDNYFEYLNRLNIQLGYWRLRFSLRLDSQAYANVVTPDSAIEYTIRESERDGDRLDSNRIIDRANEYLTEINTRYRPSIFPAKLALTYQQPGVEITAGDFYAQLGRGIVLSVRKIDELAVDTTIRGGKAQASRSFGDLRLGGTFLAGQMNPQRADEATGRFLSAASSPMFFGFPEPAPLSQVDATGRLVTAPTGVANYAVDTLFGGRVEGGHTLVQGAANISVLLREKAPFATNRAQLTGDQIITYSGSINLPQLSKYADLYAEVAGQKLARADLSAPDREPRDIDGYGVYVNANARLGPAFSVTLEGKHFRRVYPLSANVENAEFTPLAYSQPPTAEPIYVQPVGMPNVCNTGGWAQARYRFNREAALFGWLGYYASFSEKNDTNILCDEKSENRTNSWDAAAGSDIYFEDNRTHIKATLGGRLTDLDTPTDGFVNVPGTTSVFYREGYIRYDVVKHITGPWSVQSQGFHRRRYLPERFGNPWWEGENYLALIWAPRLTATFGFEFTDQPGCSRDAADGQMCYYVSGGLQYRGSTSDGIWGQLFNTVTLFVGQRRAAIRCVSGVCRQFPPFEGAKLELISRF